MVGIETLCPIAVLKNQNLEGPVTSPGRNPFARLILPSRSVNLVAID